MKFKAKNGHNPDGYGRFLTQKFNKKTIFRTILPYLAVAKLSVYFAFGLKIIPIIRPEIIATVIPADVAISPPFSIPKIPYSLIAFTTPLYSAYPKPVMGTVAPAPAKFTSGL